MTDGRLALALSRGALILPEDGPILVLHPPEGYDISALPRERLHVVQTFRPDYDRFQAQGYRVSLEPAGRYAAAIVVVPRAKEAARARVAQARSLTEGPIVIDGQKTDGVDSLLKEVRGRASVGEVVAKAHGKIFDFHGGDFSDWAADPRQVGDLQTIAGVFSAGGVDKGSRLLAAVLPPKMHGTVVDLGAGWGYLAEAILERRGVESLHLVEADHTALACAREAISDPRVAFHWADATRFSLPQPVDAVVTNPPFHRGRRADPSLGRAFIATAADLLKRGGELWMVANRHLPYEDALRGAFRSVQEVGGDAVFKIVHARHPQRRNR